MHPWIERLAAYGWRLIVLAVVVVGLVWLLRRLWVVVLALVVAVFLSRILMTPTGWLRRRGAPPALAASASLLGFFGVLILAGWLVVPTITAEFSSLGPTLSEAVDDVQNWVVNDSPLHLDQDDVERLRTQAGETIARRVRLSSGSVVSGVLTAVEVLTGLLLALVTTFFMLKDGARFSTWVTRGLPPDRRDAADRLADRAWATLGGYLRGAALLGVLEGTVIGVTLALVGGGLVIPVAVLTFAAAFVPFAGAIVAGVVAVLIALATAGLGGAVIVAIVAIVVQQLDNDVLSPVIYGRALQLHPLVVLFAIVAGGALFGTAGTVLAVPATAVALNVVSEAAAVRAASGETATERAPQADDPPLDEPGGDMG